MVRIRTQPFSLVRALPRIHSRCSYQTTTSASPPSLSSTLRSYSSCSLTPTASLLSSPQPSLRWPSRQSTRSTSAVAASQRRQGNSRSEGKGKPSSSSATDASPGPAPSIKDVNLALPSQSSGLLGSLRGSRLVTEYRAIDATRTAYEACARPAAYEITETMRERGEMGKTAEGEEIGLSRGPWHEHFGLLPTFSTWSQITMLHMYLFFARLRCLERETAYNWQKQLTDHFFFECERMMDKNHNITSSGMRQRYLKDLFVQWRGVIFSYDEGLLRGDATLAAALWRNVFKSREDVDAQALAVLVSYMRATLQDLEKLDDEALFRIGPNMFQRTIEAERLVVEQMSRISGA